MQQILSKTKEGVTQACKGWNWGYYHMREDNLEFTQDAEGLIHNFNLDYKSIAISSANSANEVTIEFNNEKDNKK